MSASKMFSLGNAIRIMLLMALVTVFVVIVQSCQSPENGLERFGQGTLRKLEVVDNPPPQPSQILGTSDQQTLQLSEKRGKIVLLNIWASWCPPCVAEMPMLDRLQADMGNDDFEVVTISLDRKAEEAAEFYERNDIMNLTPWHGPIDLANKVAAPGLPITIFYNRDGRELARVSGEVNWDREEARAFITHLVEN